MNAIAKEKMKPAAKIIAYMRRTGNRHTAREIAEIMGIDVGTARRRITDLGRTLEVVAHVKEGVRPVAVYQAK